MKEALVYGINDYKTSPLSAAINDAKRLSKLLNYNEDGQPNFSVNTVTSDIILCSREKLINDLKSLLNRNSEFKDCALFFFAGHATKKNKEIYLMAQDSVHPEEGLSLSCITDLVNNSQVKEIIIILDCCYSGAMADGDTNEISFIRRGASVLASSQYYQPSTESTEGGLFSRLLCAGLEGEASDLFGEVTISSLFYYLDKMLSPWDQRPAFKTNISKNIPIRLCEPKVPHKLLIQLTDLFPMESFYFPLNATFLPDSIHKIPENAEVFETLMKYRNNGIIEAVGETHLYYAALNSCSCRLTKLGQFLHKKIRKQVKTGV